MDYYVKVRGPISVLVCASFLLLFMHMILHTASYNILSRCNCIILVVQVIVLQQICWISETKAYRNYEKRPFK